MELEEGSAERPPVTWRAKSNLGLFLMWADDFGGARAILEADRQDAADEGDGSSLPDILWKLAELELWAGDWERAADYANECVEAAEWTEQAVVISLNRCARGLVNAHLGLADLARCDAEAGLARDRVGEVDLPLVLQLLALVVRKDRVDDLPRLLRGQRRIVERAQAPLLPHHWRRSSGEVQVGSLEPQDFEQDFGEIEHRSPYRQVRRIT